MMSSILRKMIRFDGTDSETMRAIETFLELPIFKRAPHSVRLLTYLVGRYVYYRSVKRRGFKSSGGRVSLTPNK
jgi:hypothetical protein